MRRSGASFRDDLLRRYADDDDDVCAERRDLLFDRDRERRLRFSSLRDVLRVRLRRLAYGLTNRKGYVCDSEKKLKKQIWTLTIGLLTGGDGVRVRLRDLDRLRRSRECGRLERERERLLRRGC